jgi:amino acid permease
MDIKI